MLATPFIAKQKGHPRGWPFVQNGLFNRLTWERCRAFGYLKEAMALASSSYTSKTV